MFFLIKYFRIESRLKEGRKMAMEIKQAKASTGRHLYENGTTIVFTGERGKIEEKDYNDFLTNLKKRKRRGLKKI